MRFAPAAARRDFFSKSGYHQLQFPVIITPHGVLGTSAVSPAAIHDFCKCIYTLSAVTSLDRLSSFLGFFFPFQKPADAQKLVGRHIYRGNATDNPRQLSDGLLVYLH